MIDPLVLRAFTSHLEKRASGIGMLARGTGQLLGATAKVVKPVLPLAAVGGAVYGGQKAIKKGTKALNHEGVIAPPRMVGMNSPII